MRFEDAYDSSHVCKQDINKKFCRGIVLETVISKPQDRQTQENCIKII